MKKINLLIYMIVILTNSLLSQTVLEKQRDSLQLLIQQSTGRQKVDLFNQLSEIFYRIDPQKALEISDSALALSQKIEYTKGETNAIINNGSANFYLGNYPLAYKKYKEAQTRISEIETPKEYSFILYRLAIAQRKQGKFNEALELAEESLAISKELLDTVSISRTLNSLGLIYWNLERFDEAITINIETQKLTKDKYPVMYAMSLSNTGLIYAELGDHKKAIELYLESLPLKEKRGDLKGVRNTINNIALSYTKLGDIKKSLDYQFRALELDKQMGNQIEMARSMDNIGLSYLELNRPVDAKPYIEESYKLRKDQPDNYDLAEITKNMGFLNYKLKNYSKANQYLQEAARISEACNCIQKQASTYGHLSTLNKELGNYKAALNYYELFRTFQDSIVNENVRNQISELETKYETEKKEQEIVVLNQEKQLAAVSLSNEKLLRNSFIGGTVTFLIVAVGLFNRYRYKSKTNKKLSEFNTKLTDLNDQLEDELNQAASYIESLLPEKLNDKIKTDWMFVPSSQLGGDSFGYFWLNETQFCFYLIDVSGHGVGAALLSTTVLNLLKSRTVPGADFSDPSSVLNCLNRSFDMEEHEGKYFAIWYGVLDIATNELTCSSAMHPPAICIGKDGLSQLGKKEIMIGAFPEYDYKNVYYQLNPSDKVFLFSDGCFELEKEFGGSFEFDEFTNIISNSSDVDKPLDSIFDELSKINMSDNFGDDYSMIQLELAS